MGYDICGGCGDLLNLFPNSSRLFKARRFRSHGNSHQIIMSQFLTDYEKATDEHFEEVPVGLDEAHKAYLVERHGTYNLDPIPSSDPNDPLNWPNKKKYVHIALISFQIMTCTFVAAGLTQVYIKFAEDYGVSMNEASYTTSVQIVIMGVLPIIFVPLMNTYGRNKFLAVSTLINFGLSIAGAYCKTYSQQIATRCLVGVFNSFAVATGSSIVRDLTFAHQRGTFNGIWSTCLVVGTPLGPIITGFIVQHTDDYKWVFFMFAIMYFLQFISWCIVDETVYFPGQAAPKWTIPAHPFDYKLWLNPLKPIKNINITLVCFTIMLGFAYANIAFIVELPIIFEPLFGLTPQQLSLQYIALIIGSFIGEGLAGPLSDWWMAMLLKRRGVKVIYDRLWIIYPGVILVMIGLIVFGVCLDKVKDNKYIISPIIGAAIGAAGQNMISTVGTAFAIDNDPKHAADVGLYVNLFRQVYGFVGPFYFPILFENLGYTNGAGLLCGLVALGGAFTVVVHLRGRRT